MAKHLSKYDFELKTEFINGELVTYKIIKSPKATIGYFTIDENNELVYIKGKYNYKWLNNWDQSKQLDISKKIKENGHFFKDAKKVTICNETYLIKSINSLISKFEIIGKTIYLHLSSTKKQYETLKNACGFIAHKYMDKRVKYWANKMKAKFSKIKFKDINSFFAYYMYSSHEVIFSFYSLGFDLKTIDYLIIHELSHYFHRGHSSLFWQKVSEYCPNYKLYEKKLNYEH